MNDNINDGEPTIDLYTDGSFVYSERPRFIIGDQYAHHFGCNVSAFVNMSYHPTSQDIKAAIERALAAAGIQKKITNLRLDHWTDHPKATDATWYADYEEEHHASAWLKPSNEMRRQ